MSEQDWPRRGDRYPCPRCGRDCPVVWRSTDRTLFAVYCYHRTHLHDPNPETLVERRTKALMVADLVFLMETYSDD